MRCFHLSKVTRFYASSDDIWKIGYVYPVHGLEPYVTHYKPHLWSPLLRMILGLIICTHDPKYSRLLRSRFFEKGLNSEWPLVRTRNSYLANGKRSVALDGWISRSDQLTREKEQILNFQIINPTHQNCAKLDLRHQNTAPRYRHEP
jgi:hypothetical protein